MDLTKDPLPKLMWQIAVPGATAFFLQTVLHLTDTWFAGKISTLAQAALSLSFPMFFVLGTFSIGLANGASALVGQALGAGDRDKARRLAGQALLMALLLSLMLMVLGPAISRPAFISMGAEDGEYLSLCLDYMNLIFYSAPLFLGGNITNALLVVQGDSRGMRNALAVSVGLNFILDWWFIRGGLGLPPLGVRGLALTTVIVQLGTLIFLWLRLLRTGLFHEDEAAVQSAARPTTPANRRGRGYAWPRLGPGFKSALRPDLELQKELWRQSIPPALNQASVGLGIYVINWFVGKFGAEAIAAYGVAVRLEQLVLLPALGLSLAMLPLAAQNDGAGRLDRAVEARKLALRWGVKISLAAFLILVFGGKFLMGLVTPDPAVQAEGAFFLKFDATIFFSYVALYVNVAFLQGLKRPMFAVWIGLYRQIAAPVLLFWLLAFTLGLGTGGIWLGIAVVTSSGALIAEAYTRKIIKQKLARQ